MLQSIRDRISSGPVVWFIVALICIPMAFFGIESFRTSGGDRPVIEVGSEKIYEPEVQAAVQRQIQQFRAMFGDQFTPDMVNPEIMRRSAVQQLSQDALLRQYAHAEGFRVSDRAVLDYLSEIPAFQQDGRFSAEAYRTALAGQGMVPSEFERRVSEALAIEQMRQLVLGTSFLTPAEVVAIEQVRQQQRDVTTATLKTSAYRDRVEPSADDIQAYYDAHQSLYEKPERVRLAWVDLDASSIQPAADPGDEVLKALYEAEAASRFSVPETVSARHILFEFGDDKAAAKQKADKALAEIQGGADFAGVAKAESDDPGSAQAGGDLGIIERGTLDETLEDALFAAPVGVVGGPVESEFGWHVYRVDAHDKDRVRPFSDPDVRSALLTLYRDRDAQERFREMADKLEQVAFENPESLDPVAAAVNGSVQQSDWISREDNQGIAAYSAIRDLAFDPSFLDGGENSEPLQLSPTRLAVIRKIDYEQAQVAPLESVESQVRTAVIEERSEALARADAQAVIDKLGQGTTLADAIADTPSASIGTDGRIGRNASDVPGPVLSAAFKLPHPVDGAPSADIVSLDSGDLAIVVLRRVIAPEQAKSDATQQSGLRESLAGSELLDYQKAMEDTYPIELGDEAPAENS